MKKIVYGLLATVTGLVLLFSYRTSLGDGTAAAAAGSGASAGTSGADDSASTGGTSPSGTDGSASSSGTSPSGLADGRYTGSAAQTRYGAVQVSITVSGGTITAIDVPQYPDHSGRDAAINSRAIPQLVSETLAAQSAQISLISGATYTSEGYARSLQSAIDQATR